MSTTTVTVLNDNELKDGELSVPRLVIIKSFCILTTVHVLEKKSRLETKERSCCQGSVTKYMRLVPSVLSELLHVC